MTTVGETVQEPAADVRLQQESPRRDPKRDLDAGSHEALLEAAKLLHSSLKLDDLLSSLLRSVMGRLVISRGLLALASDDGVTVAVSRGLKNFPPGSPFDPDGVEGTGIDLLLPVGDPVPTGYLGLGKPLAGTLTPQDRRFLEALLGIAASAIENARAHENARQLNQQLDRRVHQLRTLLELVRSLTAALEPDKVAQLLGLTLAGQWLIGKYAVIAYRDGHSPVVRQRGMRLEADAALRAQLDCFAEPTPVAGLPECGLRQTLEAAGAAVVVPLRAAEGNLGLVALGAPAGGRDLQAEDLTFCAGLADQAVVALENAWNFAEAVRRQKLERDLALASDIQKGLFPTTMPPLPGFTLAARSRPAALVGGDYYDVVAVDEESSGRHLLCVADVSGKGFAASLLMSNMQATLRALLSSSVDLAALVRNTNRLLHDATPSNKFVTAIFVLVDVVTGRCLYVNAGHNDGLLVRADGTVEPLKPGGVPIGLFPRATYGQAEVEMRPGDLIALYSDGVNEANDADGNEWGEEALVESLRRNRHKQAAEVLAGVFQDVDAFVGDADPYDDLTLLILKRQAAADSGS